MPWADILGAVNGAFASGPMTEDAVYAGGAGNVSARVEFEREETDAGDLAGERISAIGHRSEFAEATVVGRTLTINSTVYTIVEARPEPDDRIRMVLRL